MRALFRCGHWRAIALATSIAAVPLLAAETRAGDSPTVEFRPVSAEALRSLSVMSGDRRETQPARQPVSDLLVQFIAVNGAAAALESDLDTQTERRRAHFEARLMVVSGGRLHAAAGARCRSWQDDVAFCEVECDGGGFALRRRPGMGAEHLELLVGGNGAADLGEGWGEGAVAGSLSLAGCSETGNSDLVLTTRASGGTLAISLRRERGRD
ncbi:MAG: hypothetical protein NW216_15325 [Hyphomicrobium sp.]|nr:hypothetical protein [Hyphomicrobium sp.]